MDKNVKVFWRMGIRDKRQWDHWDWSPEFKSFDECLNAYRAWIAANPRRVIQFVTRTATIPTTGKGAQQ